MTKDSNELIVAGFEKGMAISPFIGIGLIRNLDIATIPGIVKKNFLPEKKSGSTVTGKIYWFALTPSFGTIYCGSDDGKVYKTTDNGDTWAVIGGNSGNASSGVYWKNYIITKGTTNTLDAYGPISGSPVWSNAWATIDVSQGQTISPMLSSIDGNLYIGNGKYVDKVQELTTFAPGSGATFTKTAAAITLGSNYQVRSMVDLGSNLLIATISNGFSILSADIFPYSRSSLTLKIPIQIANENGIGAMLTVNNRTYVVTTTGRLYITDSSSARLVARIPPYAITTISSVYSGAIAYADGELLFGISTNGQSNGGVWAYHITNRTLILKHIISTGNDGTSLPLNILALQPLSNQYEYLIGWQDNTSYGIDKINANKRCVNGYLESKVYKIGTALNKKTYRNLEYYLSKLLTNNDSIVIKYRKSLDASWTAFGTFDISSDGAVLSKNKPASVITNGILFQLRIELGYTDAGTPELKELIFR